MADEIQPALTAEEWREALTWPNGLIDYTAKRLNVFDLRGGADVMALLNAALPDDDPRKITRADVAYLQTCATVDERGHGELHPPDDDLLSIADKLAALLPPESSTV